MSKEYVVFSDLHGCASEFKLLLNKMPLSDNTTIIFLGDYVDRGPNSKEVIDTILKLKETYEVICLKGNHEQLFEGFLADQESKEAGYFIYNGGGATLASYANDNGEYVIPGSHFTFLEELKYFHETEDYFFVHAGVPNKPLKDLTIEEDGTEMLWIRNPFFKSKFEWEKLIVHGHTPLKEPYMSDRRINIDTGCVYDNLLTAVHLPEKKFYSVQRQKIDREIHLRDQSSNRRAVRFKGAIPVYIHSRERLLQFETQDYSQVGMLIRNIITPEEKVLEEGIDITGEIGHDSHQTLFFKGRVVRINQDKEDYLYAIEIFEMKPDPL
jgi:serine/threonine protein phosphatase 1